MLSCRSRSNACRERVLLSASNGIAMKIRITLRHLAVVVAIVSIWAAQAALEMRYVYIYRDYAGEFHFPKEPTRWLGATNLLIIIAALWFRRYGWLAVWGAIAAAMLATVCVSIVLQVMWPSPATVVLDVR